MPTADSEMEYAEDPALTVARDLLEDLTPEQRIDLLEKYCRHCGEEEPCQCGPWSE